MAQQVPVAGLAKPVSVGDRGVGTALREATSGVKQLQTNRLTNKAKDTVEEAGRVADRTRQRLEAQEGQQFAAGTTAGESAALLETAGATTTEELLSRQGQEVGERANRVFGRYRQALAQGATNTAAAKIAVEKEMQSLISMNPAYADVIRSEAARAMGQTEFNLLIRDRENLPASGSSGATSQFEKDLQSVYDAADNRAVREGWSEAFTNSYKSQLANDLEARYFIENTNERFAAMQTSDANTSTLKMDNLSREVGLKRNELVNSALEAIASNGGLTADGQIPMMGVEQMEEAKVQVAAQIENFRLRMTNTLPSTMPPQEREERVTAALKPLTEVQSILNSHAAPQALESLYKAQSTGMKLSTIATLPFYTTMHETFGENAQYVIKQFQDDPLSALAFQNSAYVQELREGVNNGTYTREQIPQLIMSRVTRNMNNIASGGPVEWDLLNDNVVAPMAANASPAERNKDDQYGTTVRTMGANAPLELSATIAGTQDLDKPQKEIVSTWDNAVKAGVSALSSRVASINSRRPEELQTYVDAVVGADGSVQFVQYRAVAGRDTEGFGVEEGGEPVWRVQTTTPVRDITSGVRNLTTRFGVGESGSRSVIGHPQMMDRFYGQTEEEYIGNLLFQINGTDEVPEWVPRSKRVVPEQGIAPEAVQGTVQEIKRLRKKDVSALTDEEALILQAADSAEFDGLSDEERDRAAARVITNMRQRR